MGKGATGGRGGIFVALAATLTLAAAEPAAAGEWQTATKVPPSAGVTPNSPTVVGLADNGAAAIAYVSGGDITAATRDAAGGAWSVKEIWPEAAGASALQLDMNSAGDVVIGFALTDGSGFAGVAYKPAGGAWEATHFLDNHTLGSTANEIDVAINSAGDVVAAWGGGEKGTPPKSVYRSAARSKSGSWPATGSYLTVATEPILTTQGTTAALRCGGPAVAIADSGQAIAAWASVYGSFDHNTSEGIVCGVRTSHWNGSAWSAAADVTSRPAVGYKAKTGPATPSVGTPVAASDPVSGALTLAFRYNPDAVDHAKENAERYTGWSTAVYGGSVAGGAGGAVETASIGPSGATAGPALAVGVTGSHAAVATSETDGKFESTYSVSSGLGTSGSPFGLGVLVPEQLSTPATDAGGNGSGFAVYDDIFPIKERKVVVSTAAAGGSFGKPETLIGETTNYPGVAANCHGDALAAGGGNGGLFYADYLSGETGACGSGPAPGGGGGPAPGGGTKPAGPPSAGAPGNAITVKPPTYTADGKVIMVVIFPGGGAAVLKATAKADSGDLARVSAKKTIVAAQKKLTVTSAGSQRVVLAPTAAAKKVVKKRGKLAAKLAVTFTPTGGKAATVNRSIVFKAPKKK